MLAETVPRFFLYGEPPCAVRDRFLHLEPIDDRTRPANWNIRPHTHAELSHVFHIVEGGGQMQADERIIAFRAPCLLLAPSNLVHGFAYETETSGSVLTISDAYLRDLTLRTGELAGVFDRAACLPVEDENLFVGLLARLGRELAWTAVGHDAAVEALLTTLLIEVLRISRHADADAEDVAPSPQTALVARFRARIEARFRSGEGVEVHAAALGVSAKRLRSACLAVAGATPLQMIQERVVLEARRALLYSNKTVAEVAYDLGFEDPAYFSRFFARTVGRPPRVYRSTGGA